MGLLTTATSQVTQDASIIFTSTLLSVWLVIVLFAIKAQANRDQAEGMLGAKG